ncbi:MAG: hypothetical protein JW863_05030 [Chitinispirillaceae bacterium]|nr:hypothetical protein [Chitinispirillaceae bacterium]
MTFLLSVLIVIIAFFTWRTNSGKEKKIARHPDRYDMQALRQWRHSPFWD